MGRLKLYLCAHPRWSRYSVISRNPVTFTSPYLSQTDLQVTYNRCLLKNLHWSIFCWRPVQLQRATIPMISNRLDVNFVSSSLLHKPFFNIFLNSIFLYKMTLVPNSHYPGHYQHWIDIPQRCSWLEFFDYI